MALYVPLNFPEKLVPYDPYFIGLWLGDGDQNQPQITTADNIIVNYLKEHIPIYGFYLQTVESDKYKYRFNMIKRTTPHPFMKFLKDIIFIKINIYHIIIK